MYLRWRFTFIALLFFLPSMQAAAATEWQRYTIAATGLSVDVPSSIFEEDGGATEGNLGRQFYTRDRRASLTIRSFPNSKNDPPAVFLQKMNPPTGIQYRRV